MKKYIIFIVLFCAGCSGSNQGSGEAFYKDSHNGVRITIPPPLTDALQSHFYDLPDLMPQKVGVIDITPT